MIYSSPGSFIIEDCDFGYAGDDCINIHDNSSMGIQLLDSHPLLARRVTKESVLFVKASDWIEENNHIFSTRI